jgi:hypothetical protein
VRSIESEMIEIAHQELMMQEQQEKLQRMRDEN